METQETTKKRQDLIRFAATTEIDDIRKVSEFFDLLIKAKVNFHPDDDFGDYINFITCEKSFTDEEAKSLNKAMAKCFEVCEQTGTDIYKIGIDTFRKTWPPYTRAVDDQPNVEALAEAFNGLTASEKDEFLRLTGNE